MLIILKKNSAPEKTADLITLLAGKNISVKQTDNILILSGDTWAADTSIISSFVFIPVFSFFCFWKPTKRA